MNVFLVVYIGKGIGKETLAIYADRQKADEHADFVLDMIKRGSAITRPDDNCMVEPRMVK